MKTLILVSITLLTQLALADITADGTNLILPFSSKHNREGYSDVDQAKQAAEMKCIERINSSVNTDLVNQFFDFAQTAEATQLEEILGQEVRAASDQQIDVESSAIRERTDIRVMIRFAKMKANLEGGKEQFLAAFNNPIHRHNCIRRESMYASLTKVDSYRGAQAK